NSQRGNHLPPGITSASVILAYEIIPQRMFSAEVVVVEVPRRHRCMPYYVIVRFCLLTKEMECFEQT
ncbi:hypothetical protein M9458_022273, partial [Cirrhinus mrigala]